MSESTSPDEEAPDEEESDAGAAESEWHTWVAAMIVLIGGILVLAPDDIVPELVGGLGLMFIVLGVVGWSIQWAYKKYGSTQTG